MKEDGGTQSEEAGGAERSSRWRRILGIAGALLVVLELLWIVLGNLVLVPRLPELVNRRPERFQMEFTSARTWVPLRFHLEGVELRGQTERARWWGKAEKVETSVGLLGLPFRRLSLMRLRAEGVEARVLRRPPDSEECCPPPTGDPDRIWTFALDGIVVRDLRDLWVDRYRFQGEARVTGSLAFRPRHFIEVSRSRARIRHGEITDRGEPAASGLKGELSLSLPHYELPGWDAQRFLGRSEIASRLQAEMRDVDYLNHYLRELPTFRLQGGRGRLDARLLVRHGLLRRGSRLRLDARGLEMHYLDYGAAGEGEVTLAVTEAGDAEQVRMEVTFREFAVRRDLFPSPHLRGQGLRAVFTSRATGLLQTPTDVEARLEMPGVRADDLSFYNHYLPEGVDLRIDSGRATLSGHLRVTVRDGEGELLVEGEGIRGQYGDLPFESDLLLHTRIHDVDLDRMRIDLSGTELQLRNAFFTDPGEPRPEGAAGWWGNLTTPRAKLYTAGELPGTKMEVVAKVEAEIQDIGPVLALFTGWKRYREVKDELETERVEGRARVRATPLLLEVLDLEVDSEGLELRGCLRSDEGVKDGALYARKGILSLGVELIEGERDLKILRSKRWYRRQEICDRLEAETAGERWLLLRERASRGAGR